MCILIGLSSFSAEALYFAGLKQVFMSLFLRIVILLLFASPLQAQNSMESDSVHLYIVASSQLQALSRPSVRAKSLGSLERGDTLRLREGGNSDWYAIDYEGKLAFVQKRALRKFSYSREHYALKQQAAAWQQYLAQELHYERGFFWLLFLGGLAFCLALHGLWLWAYEHVEEESYRFGKGLPSHATFSIWGLVLGFCYQFSSRAFLEHLVLDGFSWAYPAAGFWVALAWLLLYLLAMYLVYRFFYTVFSFALWEIVEASLQLLLRLSFLLWGFLGLLGLWYPMLFLFGLYWLYLVFTTPSDDREWFVVLVRRR